MEKYYQENFFKKLSQDDYTFFDVCDKIDNYDKDYVVDIVFNYLDGWITDGINYWYTNNQLSKEN